MNIENLKDAIKSKRLQFRTLGMMDKETREFWEYADLTFEDCVELCEAMTVPQADMLLNALDAAGMEDLAEALDEYLIGLEMSEQMPPPDFEAFEQKACPCPYCRAERGENVSVTLPPVQMQFVVSVTVAPMMLRPPAMPPTSKQRTVSEKPIELSECPDERLPQLLRRSEQAQDFAMCAKIRDEIQRRKDAKNA